MVTNSSVIAGSPNPVLVEIFEEGVPKDNTWPDNPKRAEHYTEEAFGLFDLPQKYVSTGVRANRAFPTMVRATARVSLPAGTHRLLLRSRGQARLLVDGEDVMENPFAQATQYKWAIDGFLPLEEQDEVLALGPYCRPLPPGIREDVVELEFDGKEVVFVLETLIGQRSEDVGEPFRLDLGETVVAVALEGSDRWQLLSPGARKVHYTDVGWKTYAAERSDRLAAMNQARRQIQRAANSGYWNRRRAAAREYLQETREEPVPELPQGYPAFNAIDHFLGERIHEAELASSGGDAAANEVDYFRDIKPILEAKCYDCHQGSKVKGGLRLDTREAAFAGGKADGPGIVPHDPEESSIMFRILSPYKDEVMPAKGDPLTEDEVAKLTQWIEEGAVWPEFEDTNFAVSDLADDMTFLRRVYLDTVGVTPNEDEIERFLADSSVNRRARLIDELLADHRWADHQMGYWLDILAENPNLINATLNNTGPFRWWVYESMLDNKPLDLFVTELVRMEGSRLFGGPAGFAIASQNDVPMAAKGIIISSAFLGVEMQCARCHDAPSHVSKQEDLFSLAAMLAAKPLDVPESSSVSLDKLSEGGRKPLISVTLPPGSVVDPSWPFARYVDKDLAKELAENPDSSRDRLAALITAPQNERFAEVMVNRIWQRLMGRGLVETASDWEKSQPTHPELLRWLARELVRSDYDQKAIMRLVLNSHAYQREADPTVAKPGSLFVARSVRRIRAEQLVDSLFSATGKSMADAVGPVNIDIDGARPIGLAQDLGAARRSWTLTSGSNERDRPSLMLPRLQAVTEVLEVFGWRGARTAPGAGIRDTAPNVLQPALLANGTMMTWLTRMSDDNGLTAMALEDQSVENLVERLYLRLFTRSPTDTELKFYAGVLHDGYESRKVIGKLDPLPAEPRRKFVAWSNHNIPEANSLRIEEETDAKRGPAPTRLLREEWRSRYEDVVWAMLNAPEWTRVM